MWHRLLFSLFLVTVSFEASAQADPWPAVRAADPVTVAVPDFQSGATRLRLPMNGPDWEDSPYVTPDGQRLLFALYPDEDLIEAVATQNFVDDLDSWLSTTPPVPFSNPAPDCRASLCVDLWSAAGAMEAADGAVFYHSNEIQPSEEADLFRWHPTDTPIGVLPMNGPTRTAHKPPSEPRLELTNPHYCESKDELWLDAADQFILVLADAAANGFGGTAQRAPAPLDGPTAGAQNFQPWLTDDCDTMYFTSTRESAQYGAAIYRSSRMSGIGANSVWSPPELVLYGDVAVAEPSVTDAGELYFVQVFRYDPGGGQPVRHTSDIFMLPEPTSPFSASAVVLVLFALTRRLRSRRTGS